MHPKLYLIQIKKNSLVINYVFLFFYLIFEIIFYIAGRIITSGWVVANSKLYKKMKNISEINNKNKSVPSSKKQNTDLGKEYKSLTLQETDIPKHKKRINCHI